MRRRRGGNRAEGDALEEFFGLVVERLSFVSGFWAELERRERLHGLTSVSRLSNRRIEDDQSPMER